MNILYFDIDGTLLDLGSGKPKKALSDGAFEAAVRRTGIKKLVCVGSFVDVISAIEDCEGPYDGIGDLFKLCGGVFSSEGWFRKNVIIIKNSANRAGKIDFSQNWWYVDDLAEYFFRSVGLDSIFSENSGGRIFVPSPGGDGAEILKWLEENIE